MRHDATKHEVFHRQCLKPRKSRPIAFFPFGPWLAAFECNMDPLTAAAASGLQARMDSLDLLANNLSNTSTSGYKADREFYSTYLSADALNAPDPAVGDSPVVERHWTDFTQGSLTST